MTRNQFRSLAAVVLVCACILGSCTRAPAPVRPGTPAFFWAAAEAAWRAGDYVKTNDNLSQLVTGDNEYAARARVWQLVLASGLVQGYGDLADAYQAGSRYNRTDAAGFREQVRVARAAAAQLSLQCGETFRSFLDADKSTSIVFAFAYPTATLTPPPLGKLNKGILLKGAEAETLQTAMLQRGVGQAASRVASAETFGQGVPRAQFLTAVAAALYEQSKLFGPKKLDQPQRLQALCGLAQEALRAVPPSAKTRELQGNIQKALGKRRLT
jgi:hypothetical protein